MTTSSFDDLTPRVSLAADEARAFAEQAEHYGDAIRDAYATPAYELPDRTKRIAALHQRQGEALKLAEIHATLAIADAVASLTRLVDALLDAR